MANWRQVQGRIRRAKTGADAPAKLADLYAKTHDAMVAFELGVVEEKAAHNDEAIRWYTTAFEKFRRADWRKKAADALERLGAPVPAETSPAQAAVLQSRETDIVVTRVFEAIDRTIVSETPDAEEAEVAVTSEFESAETPAASAAPAEDAAGHKRRRRGRRGGRGRRKHRDVAPGAPGTPAPRASLPSAVWAAPPEVESPAPVSRRVSAPVTEAPSLPSERVAHGRGGEPAIASRLAQLESMLRRLLGSQLHQLDEADEAPAGPGVFLLSDSDLVTSYYVESCKTLRIGIGQLLRGARGARTHTGGTLRARLAEHLEISESKVSEYLKKHCVVRWIQLDDEAAYLASFVIGVLRTPLNAE
jgi:hypothetical protein